MSTVSSRSAPVKGFSQYIAHSNGTITTLDGTPVRVWPDSEGYSICSLQHDDGTLTAKRVHILIYISFNGPVPPGLELDHKNKNKSDASLENLEAVSHSVNCLRGWEGREASVAQRQAAANSPRNFLTPECRRFIKRYRGIFSRRELSLMFQCSLARISQIQGGV